MMIPRAVEFSVGREEREREKQHTAGQGFLSTTGRNQKLSLVLGMPDDD